MFRELTDLMGKSPSFLNQVAYCDETRTWYMAVRSCNGQHLVWFGYKSFRSN